MHTEIRVSTWPLFRNQVVGGGIILFSNHLHSVPHIFPLASLEQKSKKELGFFYSFGLSSYLQGFFIQPVSQFWEIQCISLLNTKSL